DECVGGQGRAARDGSASSGRARKSRRGKSTLNRLELTPADADATARYKKIVCQPEALDRLMVDLFLESVERPPSGIVMNLDASDDPVHGNQEGRFFHGYR
ncbi:MAG: transposase, partial [Gammaproteobacteria bacterium]